MGCQEAMLAMTGNEKGLDYGCLSANCETPRKSNFLENGKMVISVKIRNFSRSWMTKQTLPLESSREI